MAIQIISLVIVGFITIYFLRKEKEKNDIYFGKQRKYNKKELAILNHYKSIYKPIPIDNRFPNIKRDGFELEDVALTATEIVYDAPIPTNEQIGGINIGDWVKLLFTDNDGCVERMWVEVLERNDTIFKGLLRNDAIEHEELNEGKTIYFHSNNIYDIDGGL
ncbi:DUF2314 domain-containing protein [Bacteroidales bacterium OttesenSCG-928-B11]|nr:DUF2314 domain-containing protein [Bacteroidales bacterium OttesenSCG-928-B11]